MKYRIETERENLFDVSMVIAMRVRIGGDVVFGQLENAFRKAVSVYEILNTMVVIEEDGEAYYVSCDEPLSSFKETGYGFEELINENERIRFRIEDGEYIRGFLSPDGIVFLMHHLGGDGKSLLYFIETFMSILSGEEPGIVPFANLPVASLPEDSGLPYLYRLFVNSWNRRWAGMKRVFGYADMDKAYSSFWSAHRTETVIVEYDKEELEDMIRSSKSAGCSLTSYLTAMWIRDISSKADVGYAVDGRLSDERTMGNFATGIHIRYRYDRNRTVGENAFAINKMIKARLSDPKVRYSVLQLIGRLEPTLIDTLSMEAAGAYHSRETSRFADIMCYGKKKKDLSITNLMRANIRTDYGRFRINDIAFVPPVVSYGKNLIGIITVNDKMIVTYHTMTERD